MRKYNFLKVAVIGTAMAFPASSFSQDCDQYLNKQTNAVNTKGVFLKVLGKASDVIFGTNFASLTRSAGQLQMLDNIQYERCMLLQKTKDELKREEIEYRLQQTLKDMVKLINQSGALPQEAVKQLVDNGILTPQEAASVGAVAETAMPATPITPVSANEVPVPVLPTPTASNGWVSSPFPCQILSATGYIVARGMATSVDPQFAREIAIMHALEQLAGEIEVAVKSTATFFATQTGTNLSKELSERYEKKLETTINQVIRGYRIICEEPQQNGEKHRCFVAIEINEDVVLKSVHTELKQEPELQKAVPNYEKFKAVLGEVLNYCEKTGD